MGLNRGQPSWVGATPSEKPEALINQMTRQERQEGIKRRIGQSNYPKAETRFHNPKALASIARRPPTYSSPRGGDLAPRLNGFTIGPQQ